jgi:hypothetical protein
MKRHVTRTGHDETHISLVLARIKPGQNKTWYRGKIHIDKITCKIVKAMDVFRRRNFQMDQGTTVGQGRYVLYLPYLFYAPRNSATPPAPNIDTLGCGGGSKTIVT